RAYDLAELIRKKSGMDSKVCILGHIQRGGSPTASDRILASRLGGAAVESLLMGHTDCMVGVHNHELVRVPLEQTFGSKKSVRKDLIRLAQILSI
ncbi:MAG: 6-phosphofructokinase, partial [Bdellovibrionales bacterium]|nr:6-phosphofructokinase [Bdellovibrionales bacterium]